MVVFLGDNSGKRDTSMTKAEARTSQAEKRLIVRIEFSRYGPSVVHREAPRRTSPRKVALHPELGR